MDDQSIPLTYTVSPGLNFNDTSEFSDENSAWSYSNQITTHVDHEISQMRTIFNKKRIIITDPPYSAEPHSRFPIVNYNISSIDQDTETRLAKKNTAIIYRAIKDLSDEGGGTLVIPSINDQIFYTSAIRLESNVNLHIESGCTVKFSGDPRLYEGEFMRSLYPTTTDDRGLTFTRFESVELMNYSPFIYCYGKKNVGITGGGVLDGSASIGDGENGSTMRWHQWKKKCRYQNHPEKVQAEKNSRMKLFKEGQLNSPVKNRQYGHSSSNEWSGSDDGFLRPNFIQFYNCQNVLIEGVTIINSPMWEINPVLCDTVLIQKVRIESHLNNNDGCDPECSSNVVIRENYFDVGDDCIAIKSGRNGDGLRVKRPCFNVVIDSNKFIDGHGGVTIGSEITNGVKNIFSCNNMMNSCNLQSAYRFKTNYIRGGNIENIYYKNDVVKMIQNNRAVINVDLNYNILNEVEIMELMNVKYCAFVPFFHHVFIKNLLVNTSNEENHGGKFALQLKGFNAKDIASSCTVNENIKDCYVSDISIKESSFIGCLHAFDLKNVDGLNLEKVKISGTKEMDLIENCKNIVFKNCDFRNSAIQSSDFSESTSFENTLFSDK